eukprot:1457088-Prymnesium_polylepis.2
MMVDSKTGQHWKRPSTHNSCRKKGDRRERCGFARAAAYAAAELAAAAAVAAWRQAMLGDRWAVD